MGYLYATTSEVEDDIERFAKKKGLPLERRTRSSDATGRSQGYRIPEETLDRWPTDSQGHYFGDEMSGHPFCKPSPLLTEERYYTGDWIRIS